VNLEEKREITCEDESAMYSNYSKACALGWESIRKQVLSTVTESVGMPAGRIYMLCMNNHACISGDTSIITVRRSQFSLLGAVEQWKVHLSLERAIDFLSPFLLFSLSLVLV